MKSVLILVYLCNVPQYIIAVDPMGSMRGAPEDAPEAAVVRLKAIVEDEGSTILRMDVDKEFNLVCM